MAMIGEQFLVGDEICGIVLSLRNPWDQVNRQNHESKDQLFLACHLTGDLITLLIVILAFDLAPQLGRQICREEDFGIIEENFES